MGNGARLGEPKEVMPNWLLISVSLKQVLAMSGAATGSNDAQPTSSSDRFHFLRSLRDVLFGRRGQRRRGRRTSEAVAVPRVKSSRSLDDELQSTASTDSDGSRLVAAAPTTDIACSK